ncbi:MAG TPA: oxidoreductase [Candidatus Sumerlaeota bacterium]|nr:oxidoreductase [Candidatus Sumerlaeota bacterium]HON50373.1 oxidoreductase [Candidatus Sumerlaeota bacterium]HOR63589.1 oxidoreductase [Candidatus Sumerlaeota bacterium]HPL73555.1 oxidoreductase [Candidatus Sumerlaeota bacterium]HRU54679.1 oxidoreductase [Candidatus Sumerlaeia bacterium]
MAEQKLKLAFYWAAGCGGCEVSVLDIDEKILDVAAAAEIVMWPVAIDTKYKEIRALPDKTIDITFFNGAIRNNENEEMAHLFRAKSKILIAFGVCAVGGGIVGLGNMYDKKELLEEAFINTPSTENADKIIPVPKYKMPEGEVHLPDLNEAARALDQVTSVDYYIPGCPPQASQVLDAVNAILEGDLPPKGSVIGSQKTLCDECERRPKEGEFKKIKSIADRLDVEPDPEKCLLEQGFICMGAATRGGCGAKCPSANVPCTGCSGPAPHVKDQGAKMISALASILQTDDEEKKTDEDIMREIQKIKDPIGTFYRYFLARSIIPQKVKDYEP